MSDLFSGTMLEKPRCYQSHPGLRLGTGILFGGSASRPVVKDADVYISLQYGSKSLCIPDPWEKRTAIEVFFPIEDMDVPRNVPRFKKMVTWICTQLQNGKRVHVGCIGGHGRTGLVFSAILAEMKHTKRAIQLVRKYYCEKAVESKEQIQFLMEHYGVIDAEPTKKPMLIPRWSEESSSLMTAKVKRIVPK